MRLNYGNLENVEEKLATIYSSKGCEMMSKIENPYDTLDSRGDTASSTRKKWTKHIVTTLVCLLIGFVLLGLLLPATRRARPASYRMVCSSNLRSLAMALMSYEKVYGQLPPAYTVDEHGKAMQSW